MAPDTPKPPHLPDALRRAVDRTVQSTLGSAGSTRERAQDMVDDVLRIAEEGAARAGRSVRGVRDAGRQAERRASRQAEAAAGVPDRLRGAIGDLRFATRDEVRALQREIAALGDRVAALELRPAPIAPPSPGGPRGASKAAASEPAGADPAADRPPER